MKNDYRKNYKECNLTEHSEMRCDRTWTCDTADGGLLQYKGRKEMDI